MFLDLKAQIEKEYSPDYVLIDARTGITEMGGAATSILADQIVVLLLDSDEHLEGSRAVLRAFTSYRDPSPRISVVLSRLPADAGEREDVAVSAHVCGELNKGISRENTSFVSRVLPLHNDPDVGKKERVLLASEPSESQRVLFRDYLRLVLALFGPQEVEQHLSSLVDKARVDLLVSPDESEKNLEDIVRIAPHTDALATLLRLYRVRNRTAGRVEDVLRQILAIEGSRRLDFVALWDAFAFWFEPMPSMGQLTGASKTFFELWKQSQFSDFQTGLFFYHQLKKYSQVGTPLSVEWLKQWEREEWLGKINAKGDLKIPFGVLSQHAQIILTYRFGFDCFDMNIFQVKIFFFSHVDGRFFNEDVQFVRFFLEHLEHPQNVQRGILGVALNSILHWIQDESNALLLKPYEDKIFQMDSVVGHGSRQYIKDRFSSVKSLEIASNLDKRGQNGGRGGGRWDNHGVAQWIHLLACVRRAFPWTPRPFRLPHLPLSSLTAIISLQLTSPAPARGGGPRGRPPRRPRGWAPRGTPGAPSGLAPRRRGR
jgi:hypothetical protein